MVLFQENTQNAKTLPITLSKGHIISRAFETRNFFKMDAFNQLEGTNKCCVSVNNHIYTMRKKGVLQVACNPILKLQWSFSTHYILTPMNVVGQVAWVTTNATHYIYNHTLVQFIAIQSQQLIFN